MTIYFIFTEPTKRVTKRGLAKRAAVKPQELTPRKKQLLEMVQEKHKETSQVRRRLRYTRKQLKIQSNSIRTSEALKTRTINSIDMSMGARWILDGEKRNFSKAPTARKWLLKEKCWALSIYKRSARTYRYLRAHITLPSEKTVKNLLSAIQLEPGVYPFLLKILERKTKNYSNPKDRIVVIIFDEMFAEDEFSYNPVQDKIDGYEDFGKRGRTHLLANHVLVFKVRILSTGITLPIAY